MSSSSKPPGFINPDSRQNSASGPSSTMNDARNPRLDSVHGQQSQQFTPLFETSSPVSIDFNFPFGGSPHGSSNSGIDVPPDIRLSHSQGFPNRGSMADTTRFTSGTVPSPQHRPSLASIDSAFDRDIFGQATVSQWTPANSGNQAVSNSDSSPRKPTSTSNDKKVTEDGKPPAWSELKTKAGKERKRLPLACIACRRKKIRCSGEKPACKHCLRARVPCVYKVTTRKAAPRTDYMAMLDKRLKRMEDRVIRVIPKEELPDMNVTGRASVRPPLPSQPSKKEKEQPKKRSADEAFTAELLDWRNMREKSTLLDPTSGLRKQREGENKLFIEGSESLPPQHIQEHLAEVFFDCVYGQSYLLLHKPSFMRKLKSGTVPPVLILAVCAISARFSTHPQVSTEPAFLRGEQWATPARRIVEKRHYEPNITILTAMLMLGLHYFGTCEGGLSWSFGGQAMRMGYALQLHRELDHDPLGRNQIANTDIKSKGLKSPELSFTDREIRRRTMWACYLMDTFNSSGTERPSFLNEDYFQIQLPIKESHFQMEIAGPTEDLYGNVPISTSATGTTDPSAATEAKDNMGVAAYIVRAVVLWKRIVKYLNLGGKDKDPHPIWDPLSTFSTLQRQITQLKTSLPATLEYSEANLQTHVSTRLANQFLFLHIALAQSSLFLHRFAVPTHPHSPAPPPNMPPPFLKSSAATVLGAAALISSLIASSTGLTLTVPFAGYCAYAASTVHVWGIFSSSASLAARSKDGLRACYKYLTRMKRYWGMFHYMAESVKDIYRVFADVSAHRAVASGAVAGAGGDDDVPMRPRAASMASPAATGQDSGTKSMFQYGDWFDKYPHGVSEAEWEKSHLEYRGESKGAEAVMSQRSELQSVEEFFASLSPPSKAEDGAGLSGRKKTARRRGKSLVERKAEEDKGKKDTGREGATTSSTAAAAAGAQGVSASGMASQGAIQAPSQGARHVSIASQSTDSTVPLPNFDPTASDFGINSMMYNHNHGQFSPQPLELSSTSQQAQNPNPGLLSYPSFLPAIDRQMVFGAYSSMDLAQSPTYSTSHPRSATQTQTQHPVAGQTFGSTNWDAFDPSNFNFGDTNMMDTTSSAWILPFNIEPPSYDGQEFGGVNLDGMDLGDFGQGDPNAVGGSGSGNGVGFGE